jgi:parallel beta-helix repeat protein
MPRYPWRRSLLLSAALAAGWLVALPGPARASATLVVNTTADLPAPCQASAFSLRCAIAHANADGSGDTISFGIPINAPGCTGTPVVCTIQPRRALPALRASSTVIDGSSQPGATPDTVPISRGDNAVITVRLDGTLAGKGVDGIDITGAHDTVRGLSITGFIVCFVCGPIPGQQTGGAGLSLRGVGDVVAGNMIGVEPDGRTPVPNQFTAVEVVAAKGPVGNEVIGGDNPAATNLLSGNKSCMNGDCEGFGVDVESGAGTLIERNLIGTTASGRARLANATGVVLLSPGNRLGGGSFASGNVISGSFGDGVLLGASGTVTGNLVGTNATGRAALRNRSHGIDAQSSGVVIRNNVISANGDTGVVLFGGDTVQGNKIGTDAAGRVPLGNGLHPSALFLGQPINGTDGIVTCGDGNTIGGPSPGAGNLISASGGDGISLVSSHNIVEANTIGTDVTGTTALGNHVDGVGSRSDVLKGTGFCQQAASTGGSDNLIGGAATGEGNLISGNVADGVDLVASNRNVIAGNRVGTNDAGTVALGNGGDGVFLGGSCDGGTCAGSSSNTIGGTTPAAGNMISGQAGDGVHIDGQGAGISNVVEGNTIGARHSGPAALGNHGAGVLASDSAVNDTIGGTGSGSGNTIDANGGPGVLIGTSAADSGTHAAVQGNIIEANGGLGIDLAPSGTVNCASAPPGPNDYIRCPVIATATTTKVTGHACAGCLVEIYLAAPGPGDQGHGEAAALLATTTAAADGTWTAALSPGQLSAGASVTATTTTPASFQNAAETSEFSHNHTAT